MMLNTLLYLYLTDENLPILLRCFLSSTVFQKHVDLGVKHNCKTILASQAVLFLIISVVRLFIGFLFQLFTGGLSGWHMFFPKCGQFSSFSCFVSVRHRKKIKWLKKAKLADFKSLVQYDAKEEVTGRWSYVEGQYFCDQDSIHIYRLISFKNDPNWFKLYRWEKWINFEERAKTMLNVYFIKKYCKMQITSQ